MKKIAIFVEGGTELIVVRDMLVHLLEGDLNLSCYSLLKGQLKSAKYNIPNPISENHFMLINSGSDISVVNYILEREQYFINERYDKIIGLRDMYSDRYFHLNKKERKVNETLNERFLEENNRTILEKAKQPDKIKICFSIMEAEAWFLGFYEIFERINNKLTTSFILEKLGINLEEIDPEKEIFRPAPLIKKIYKLVDMDYGKHATDINTITGKLSKEDYETLLSRDKCNSFNIFHETVFPQV